MTEERKDTLYFRLTKEEAEWIVALALRGLDRQDMQGLDLEPIYRRYLNDARNAVLQMQRQCTNQLDVAD